MAAPMLWRVTWALLKLFVLVLEWNLLSLPFIDFVAAAAFYDLICQTKSRSDATQHRRISNEAFYVWLHQQQRRHRTWHNYRINLCISDHRTPALAVAGDVADEKTNSKSIVNIHTRSIGLEFEIDPRFGRSTWSMTTKLRQCQRAGVTPDRDWPATFQRQANNWPTTDQRLDRDLADGRWPTWPKRYWQ